MNVKSFEEQVRSETRKLLKKSDRIAVALSGGKDSTTILYLLNKWGYNVEGITINLEMKHFKKNLENIKNLCKELSVKLHVVSVSKELGSDMRTMQLRIQEKRKISNCMVCGVFKKWLLNKKAKELGFNKLVTGHNLDDRVESIIMNLVMNNKKQSLNLMNSYESELFVQRVKPLDKTLEADIKEYSIIKGFKISYEPCPYSTNAFRREVMNLLNDYEKKHPRVKENISRFFNKVMKNKQVTKAVIRKCVNCGEPATNELCNACSLRH